MAEDEDYIRRLDQGEEYDFAPEYYETPELGIVMACPDHGNGTVPPEEIIEAANDPKRRVLNVDVLSGQTRVRWR